MMTPENMNAAMQMMQNGGQPGMGAMGGMPGSMQMPGGGMPPMGGLGGMGGGMGMDPMMQ